MPRSLLESVTRRDHPLSFTQGRTGSVDPPRHRWKIVVIRSIHVEDYLAVLRLPEQCHFDRWVLDPKDSNTRGRELTRVILEGMQVSTESCGG
jgi:hypothetical protein